MKIKTDIGLEAAGFISIATAAFMFNTILGFAVAGISAIVYAQGIK